MFKTTAILLTVALAVFAFSQGSLGASGRQRERGLGVRPPTPEEQAYLDRVTTQVRFVAPNRLARVRALIEGAVALDALPAAVDNSTLQYFPPIRSQGGQGSCTCWAACYYWNTYTQAMDEGLDVSGGNNDHICSPGFMYNLINGGYDGGAWTPYAVARLSDVGCCSWTLKPYSDSDYLSWPSGPAWIEALNRRTSEVHKIDGGSQPGIDAIKQHLANGNLAATDFEIYENFYYYYPDEVPGISNGVYYSLEGYFLGGHAVTIVGYDDNRPYVDYRDGLVHSGAFLMANSWGPGWGVYNSTGAGTMGFFWVGYNMFLEGTWGYWNPFEGRKAPFAYFNDDRDDYRPTLYVSAGLNHAQRGYLYCDGDVEFAWYSYPAIDYHGGTALPIDGTKPVAVDLTDGIPYITDYTAIDVGVWLYVDGGASSDGSIGSAVFYHDFDGNGIYASVASPDPPVVVPPGNWGVARLIFDSTKNSPPTTNPVSVSGPPDQPTGINWEYNDPEDDPQQRYEVEVWTGSGGTGTLIWDPAVGAGTETSLPYTGPLLEDGLYYARVRADDGMEEPDNWGQWSERGFRIGAPGLLGIVADDATGAVTVFDPETYTALGSVSLPYQGTGIGDCSILPDAGLGFVTTFTHEVWVIDLTTISLAPGTNPIAISNYGEETAITADGKFLVVCDGSAYEPISVVDIASRTEISTFWLDYDVNSLDVGSDGSVLATSYSWGYVYRLTIDSSGNLTDTGERLDLWSVGLYDPMNVYIAPSCTSGVAIDYWGAIQSFTIPGLAPVDTVYLSGSDAVSGLISPEGSRVFARSDAVQGFEFNSVTGDVGAQLVSFPIAPDYGLFAMDQMAIHPDGTRLYVSQPGALNAYDAASGAPIASITAPSIVAPTGVCIPCVLPPPRNKPPTTNPVSVSGPPDQPTSINWEYKDPEGDPQEQYEVEVWTGSGGTGTLTWDPAVGTGTETSLPYTGPLLEDGVYYARVRADDGMEEPDNWGKWSECGFRVGAIHSIGMVTDEYSGAVTVFDADTDTVLGSVSVLPGVTLYDCSILAVAGLGFVVDFNYNVWVIDLLSTPPSLASGTNPIPISNCGEETAITADGKFLLVCDGGAWQPISVVDIASRAEVSTFYLDYECTTLDVSNDGSVLAGAGWQGIVHRLTIDASGNVTDTGEWLSGVDPTNVYLSPGGASGIVVNFDWNQIHSVAVPGLALVDTRPLSGSWGISGLIDAPGGRVFARSDGGYVDVFAFDPITAQLSASPVLTFGIAGAMPYWGVEQMALHPAGTKLYVPESWWGCLDVFDPGTGALLRSITGPDILSPLGVCVASLIAPPPPNEPPTTEPVTVSGPPAQPSSVDWTYKDKEGDLQDQYEVEVWTGSGGTGTLVWDPLVGTGTEQTLAYTGPYLTLGTYYARVRASDGKDWGAWSECQFEIGMIDVTALVRVNTGGMTYRRNTGNASYQVSLTNISSSTIPAPVWAVVTDISSPSVTLVNPDATTPKGDPYFDYSTEIGGGELVPGETSAIKTWIFHNPTRVRFSYTVTILAPSPY